MPVGDSDTLDQLRNALADAFDDLARARELAERAGIPRQVQPIDQPNMRLWWWETLHIAWGLKQLVALVEVAAADPTARAQTERFEALRESAARLQERPAPARLREPASSAAPRISLSHLPETNPDLFGREAELARLDAAWASGSPDLSGFGKPDRSPGKTNVLAIVAFGGTGKTALVKRWLDRMARDGFRGATAVFGWSFYSQGAREDGQASADAFIDAGLRWFDDPDPTRGSPWEKGERLAGHFAAGRALLVLDGMEPLQYPAGGEHAGRVRDPALAALLQALAYRDGGLCVVTTREPVADVAEFGEPAAQQLDLRNLGREAGTAYLRKLGVAGEDDELAEAVEVYDGHALALTLLGTLLRDFLGGDARRWREAGPLDEEPEQGGHAQRMLAGYARRFGAGPEGAILRLMGLFDRPASAAALDALRAAPPIQGLTDALFDAKGAALSGRAWDRAVLRLRKSRLLEPRDAHAPGEVDAHPLVREHFGAALQTEAPDAFRVGHSRLYDFYCTQAPDQPDSLSQMAPLFAAVGHGCKAGRRKEAYDEVFRRRIRRGNEAYCIKKLGAFASDLAALAGFFERMWDLPARELREASRAFLLNEAGYDLRALGRAAEAEGPMRAALEMVVAQKDWNNAARYAGNLSELALALGDVAGAVRYAGQAVTHADRSGEWDMRMTWRAALADARAQAGETTNARALFAEAERMQAEWQREYPLLYSLAGYRYCDLLLDAGDYSEALRRAAQTLEWLYMEYPLLDMALDHLSLGRAHAGLRDHATARRELDAAVDRLRAAGHSEFLSRGLLARAALHRETVDYAAARHDLDEATRIAVRASFRLFEADARLEWARLHLAEGDREKARESLGRAQALIEETGYHRRDAAVAALAAALRDAG